MVNHLTGQCFDYYIGGQAVDHYLGVVMQHRFEIRVPAVANATENGWATPADSGSVEWAGTIHDFGRILLSEWLEGAHGDYAGLPAIVEVIREDGVSITIDDPTPAPNEVVAALEVAIEASAAADIAADRARDELSEAMRDAHKFGGISANNIAHRVRGNMSRPPALKILKSVKPRAA
ncbi:hypothetical protein ACFRCG_39950 [Embleya sp. NPDC056575]|uniref:hypothetical protein n=1 Tax=unclassified Embleya TaxID=2699296 RepID=UPI0036CF8E69